MKILVLSQHSKTKVIKKCVIHYSKVSTNFEMRSDATTKINTLLYAFELIFETLFPLWLTYLQNM